MICLYHWEQQSLCAGIACVCSMCIAYIFAKASYKLELQRNKANCAAQSQQICPYHTQCHVH